MGGAAPRGKSPETTSLCNSVPRSKNAIKEELIILKGNF